MTLLLLGGGLTVYAFNTPFMHYIIARMVVFIFAFLMVIEMHYIFPKEVRPRSILISLFAGMLYPIIAMLKYTSLDPIYFSALPILGIMTLFLCYAVFVIKYDISTIVSEIKSVLFIMIYPGLLISFWFEIPLFENANFHLFMVTAGAYVIDGFAYLVGVSVGRFEKKIRKKPLLHISPKKSITGFIGGLIFGYIFFYITYSINPALFQHSIPKLILLGTILYICVMLGDLFESAIKRTFHIKDSGTLMLGRGGVLDTFDSMLFAAPMYVTIYPLLFAGS